LLLFGAARPRIFEAAQGKAKAMTFASSFVLFTSLGLTIGCARSAARPAQSATPGARPQKQDQADRTVELRHVYLLSPGPNATLVVTRSDVATPQ
jgi:hypothetical protein